MALIVKDRVKETTTTTGTGTVTLAGASTGFRSFADIGNANTTYYCISGGSQFEVGIGTYTASGTTLSRDTVLSNSLGTTALIDFSAGTKDVFVTYPSDKAILGTNSAVASTGTGSVVLSESPTLTGNAGLGVTPIAWDSTYNSLQLGYAGSINGRTSTNDGMSISSNLKYTPTAKYINNGAASQYLQTDGGHTWLTSTGTNVANTNASLTEVMILDNLGTLTLLGELSATNANLTGIIVSGGAIDLVGSATANQSLATGQSTGSLTIGGDDGTGEITLGRSTRNQTTNIQAGATVSGSTKTMSIGTGGLAGSTTNIAIGSTTGISTTTLNGKTSGRIVPRVSTTASDATPTINTDNTDQFGLTAQAVDITSFTTNLSGTPTDGQKLWIYIVGTAARAITWGASFESSTATLPTTTVSTNRLDVGFVWNVATSKWRCVAVA
jgi:hypothetical protein